MYVFIRFHEYVCRRVGATLGKTKRTGRGGSSKPVTVNRPSTSCGYQIPRFRVSRFQKDPLIKEPFHIYKE